MDRIHKVGVELEGGYTTERYEVLHTFWHGDGSVHTTQRFNGEVVTPPYDDLDALCAFIIQNYPNEVNKSCGFHIHISLKSNLDYSRLMTKRFHRYFLKKWAQWGTERKIQNKEFWNRLGMKSDEAKRYCKIGFGDPFLQAYNQGDRYHQLNFCWKKHGTMENRMLPMFQEPEIGVEAVRYYVSIVEKWLTLQKREIGFNELVDEDDEEVKIEKETICV